MKTRKSPAAVLPSSEKVLFFPNGDDFDEDVLVDLLEEAEKLNLHPFRAVRVTEKRRNKRLTEWGYDAAYVHSTMRIRYSTLLDMWKHLPGNNSQRDSYSIENERARIYSISNAIERRANWGPAIQNFMRVAAEEARTGRHLGAMYPLD